MPYYTGLYGAGELSKREKAYELRLVSLLRGGNRRSWKRVAKINFSQHWQDSKGVRFWLANQLDRAGETIRLETHPSKS